MKKATTRQSQVGHSWGILLSMSAVPLLALMAKVFPNLNTLWGVLLILCVFFFVRSAIGYFFPAVLSGSKKSPGALPQPH